jgi:hypothetical protein
VEWLLLHGTLHLLGYDDEDEEGLHAMIARQQAVMEEAGVQAFRRAGAQADPTDRSDTTDPTDGPPTNTPTPERLNA